MQPSSRAHRARRRSKAAIPWFSHVPRPCQQCSSLELNRSWALPSLRVSNRTTLYSLCGQASQQSFVECGRILDLRGVSERGKLHQLGAANACDSLFGEHRVVAQDCLDRRRREVFADGSVVLVADDEQCGYCNLLEFIVDRLGEGDG